MATDTNAEVVETEARPTDRSAEVVETEAPPTDGNIEVLETETPPADKVAEVAETETRPDLLWDDRIDCVVELTFAQTTKNGGSSRVALSCSSSVSATPLLDRGVGHLIQHPLPSASRLMGATVFHRFYMLCNAVWLRLQSVLSF